MDDVQEWAIYPSNASCADYWCFLSNLRRDLGVDDLTVTATGYQSMYFQEWHEPFLNNAGYGPGPESNAGGFMPWEILNDSELVQFFDHQLGPEKHGRNSFVHAPYAFGDYQPVCPHAEQRCYGSCMLHHLDDYAIKGFGILLNRTKTLAPSRQVAMYTENFLSTEPGASAKYSDSLVTNATGHCSRPR